MDIRSAFLLLLLAGCAPRYANLQSEAPIQAYATERTPAEFADCFVPRLSSEWGSSVRDFPDGDSRVIGLAHGNGFFYTVTARADGRVEVRKWGTFDHDDAAVRACL